MYEVLDRQPRACEWPISESQVKEISFIHHSAAMNREATRVMGSSHGRRGDLPQLGSVHPAWIALIRLCQEIGFGEIERLKIQDGVPVVAEKLIQRIKLT